MSPGLAAARSSGFGVAVVRPYDTRFREQVMRVVESLGIDAESPRVLPPGRSDADAALWLAALQPTPQLIVLPFHEHTSANGDPVDGLGVARLLAPSVVARRVPMLMPVSDFAWAAKFERRFAELEREAPQIAALIIAVPASELRDDATHDRIEAHVAAR